jgi:hypothetical protein
VLTDHSSKLNGDGFEAERAEFTRIPIRGDRIELPRPHLGVRVRGIVFYSDQLQILVKWDNGRSQSLRVGAQLFRVMSEQPATSD